MEHAEAFFEPLAGYRNRWPLIAAIRSAPAAAPAAPGIAHLPAEFAFALPVPHGRNHSDATAAAIDDEILSLLKGIKARARNLLEDNRDGRQPRQPGCKRRSLNRMSSV